MKKTIDWLLEVEDRARRVYSKAASLYPDDIEFSEFFATLSSDEVGHCAVIQRAAELIEEKGGVVPSAYLSEEMEDHILERFFEMERGIELGALTKQDLVDGIVETEFSEWNDIYRYVVYALGRHFREFVPVAVGIEKHRKNIERFLESRPEFGPSLEAIRNLPVLWKENILVVDDEEMIQDVFNAILSTEGSVECARNGSEALERLKERYYAAIVSDVDMPVMDGIEFYKKAADSFPGIGSRFVFFTGHSAPEKVEFFKRNNLRYFKKPSSIKDIKKAIVEILNRQGPS